MRDDLKNHFVWIPKYRKQLMVGAVAEATRELNHKIDNAYRMEFDTTEVVENYVFEQRRRAIHPLGSCR